MYKLLRSALKIVSLKLQETGCILISYILSVIITSGGYDKGDVYKYVWILVICLPIYIYSMEGRQMFNKTTFMYTDRIIKNVVRSIITANLIALLVSLVIFSIDYPEYQVFIGVNTVTSLILVFTIRFLFIKFVKRHRKNKERRAIIVGCGKISEAYEYFLKKTSIETEIIGCVRVSDEKISDNLDMLGVINEMEDILKENVIDEVIFTLSRNYSDKINEYIMICEEAGVTIKIVPDLFEHHLSKTFVHSIGTLPVLTYHSVSLNDTQLFVKRILDIFGSVFGLVITAIAMLFIVPIIKLESKGPVFFKQLRVGQNGRTFYMYKFRSMVNGAEKIKHKLEHKNEMSCNLMFKMKNDPRLTKSGAFMRKWSIDEMPQFWNVLKGDMSLVGTRPPTLEEVTNYKVSQRRRISIRPGITGNWQVNGRSEITDFEEVVRLDLEYIDNWSIFTDIKILLKTVVVLVTRKGAE